MKRILNGILIFFTVFTLSACGGTEQEVPLSENIAGSETENIGIGENSENDNMSDESEADIETENRILNSGYEMPIYVIGTYSLLDEDCEDSVSTALDRGVRLIDTAYMYRNEEAVGAADRKSCYPEYVL